MYLRADYVERSIPSLRAFMRANPLGILTTAIESATFPLLQSSHIPWVLDVQDETSESELGKLRGHMARANPHAKAMSEYAKTADPHSPPGEPMRIKKEVMVLFNAPVHHYVTAQFNVESKAATGKVVPTWNYAAVQAYGVATVYLDPSSTATAAFLNQQVADLTKMAETEIMGYTEPWKVEDAPTNYIRALTKAIVGIEIEITRLGGKWKMSQEESVGDRESIIQGFQRMGTETGDWMAKTIAERCALADARKAQRDPE